MIGVPLQQFWHMTPRALGWHHAAARRRDREQVEHDMTLAWMRERLARAKKVPKLADWLTGTSAKPASAKVVLGTTRDFMRQLSVTARAVTKQQAANQESGRG